MIRRLDGMNAYEAVLCLLRQETACASDSRKALPFRLERNSEPTLHPVAATAATSACATMRLLVMPDKLAVAWSGVWSQNPHHRPSPHLKRSWPSQARKSVHAIEMWCSGARPKASKSPATLLIVARWNRAARPPGRVPACILRSRDPFEQCAWPLVILGVLLGQNTNNCQPELLTERSGRYIASALLGFPVVHDQLEGVHLPCDEQHLWICSQRQGQQKPAMLPYMA